MRSWEDKLKCVKILSVKGQNLLKKLDLSDTQPMLTPTRTLGLHDKYDISSRDIHARLAKGLKCDYETDTQMHKTDHVSDKVIPISHPD